MCIYTVLSGVIIMKKLAAEHADFIALYYWVKNVPLDSIMNIKQCLKLFVSLTTGDI